MQDLNQSSNVPSLLSEVFMHFSQELLQVDIIAVSQKNAAAKAVLLDAYNLTIAYVPQTHPEYRNVRDTLKNGMSEAKDLAREKNQSLTENEIRQAFYRIMTSAVQDAVILIQEGGDFPLLNFEWDKADVIPMASSLRLSTHIWDVADAVKDDLPVLLAQDADVIGLYGDGIINEICEAVPQDHPSRAEIQLSTKFNLGSSFAEIILDRKAGADPGYVEKKFARNINEWAMEAVKIVGAEDPVIRPVPQHLENPPSI